MRRAALAGRTTPPPPERRARAESAVSKGPHRAPRTHSLWATKEEVRMSCQVDKDSSTTQEPRSGPVSAWLGEGSPVAILSPSPSTVLLPAARTSLPRRPGLAEPPLRRSTPSLPSPCPARPGGQPTRAHRRPLSRHPGGHGAGQESRSAGSRSSGRPHTLLPAPRVNSPRARSAPRPHPSGAPRPARRRRRPLPGR